MISYVFARMFIFYFREDTNEFPIFQNLIIYLSAVINNELPKDVILTLMSHTSRALVDSNPKSSAATIKMFTFSYSGPIPIVHSGN